MTQQAKRDDVFTRSGVTWQRAWVGGNSGLYVWRAHGRVLEAWQCGWSKRERVSADGEVIEDVVADYRATINGQLVASGEKLRDVMDAAARDYLMQSYRSAA